MFWLAVLAAAALPRFAQLDREFRHLDEGIVLAVSEHLARGETWDNNWARAGVGFGYRENQYNFSAYLYATHLWARVTGPLWPESWRTQWRGVRVHRAFSAVCGTLAVVMVAGLAWSLAGPAAAAAAAAAYAVTPQLVQDAHYARPEAFVALGSAAVAWLCLGPAGLMGRRGAWWPVWLAAVLVGVLTATKITLGALVVLPAWAGWRVMRERMRLRRAGDGGAGAWVWLGWCGVPLGMLAGAFAGMPYAFFQPAAYWEGIAFLREQYGGFHPPHNRLDGGPVWPLMTAYYGAVLGWLPVVLAGIGALWLGLRQQWGASLLLAGTVAFYFAYFGSQRVFFERNLAHVLPFAAVLFGAGAAAVGRWFGRGGAGAVGLGVAVLALLPAADTTVRLVTRGLTGEEERRMERFKAALSAQQPGLDVVWVTFMGPETLEQIDAAVGRGQPLLLAVNDYNDDLSARLLPELLRRYYAEEILEHRGVFWRVPVSTLNVYHGHRVRVFRVQGKRVATAATG